MLLPPVLASLAATTGLASPAPFTASVHCAAAVEQWWASPAAWAGPCLVMLSWSGTYWKVRVCVVCEGGGGKAHVLVVIRVAVAV